MSFFNLQGKLYEAVRSAGNPLGFRYLGYSQDANLALSAPFTAVNESETGNRLEVARLAGAKSATLSGNFQEWSAENLALLAYGSSALQDTDPVVDEPLPDTVELNLAYALAFQNVGSLSIQDSAGTPVTLPPAQYSVDAAPGMVTILDKTTGGPYTEPFRVSYTPGVATRIPMLQEAMPERWVRFVGINTVNQDQVLIDLYRAGFDPFASFAFKHEAGAVGLLPFNAGILADTTKAADGELGQFGRLVLLPQA